MKTKLITSTIGAFLFMGCLGSANAASVALSPDSATITIGSTVTYNYDMDFSDESTFGGGTDFWYDSSVLEFVGWSYDANLNEDDPFYRRDPTDCASANSDAGCDFDSVQFGAGLAQLNGMAFGNDSSAGIAGPATIGQMVFTAVGLGSTTIFMAANDDGVASNPGPFVSTVTFAVMDVDFLNTNSVTVTAAPVPVPAAIWFMVSGLGMIGGLRRFG